MALVIDRALIAAIFVGLIQALGLNLNVQSDRKGALNVKVDGIYGSLLELTPLRATIGKLAMSIRVAGEDGELATPLGLILRNLLKPASTAPLLIGFLIAAFTSRKQALHDALAGCVVSPRTQKT